ncbi:type 2 periplasmic-binding domain-containing protein [Rhizobium subbaraonis]|uniref:LysR family transcriptional regulator n=1 Tax=Rhizobium subbaraonis TaxID=908946 RepID=UPI002477FB7E|nr:LysR family transcriptional regulator [Rhizobium subbaraonis]
MAERGFRAGVLTPVLPRWGSPQSSMHAAFTSRHGMLPAVRALIDFLAETLPHTVQMCKETVSPTPASLDWTI